MAIEAALANLHRALFTGTVLAAVAHRGPEDAARLVFRTFRNQQRERFLPGLTKLGLDGLPHAVAAARYHYLSNALGGVRVYCHEETPRKAWVVYPAPRWLWWGTAVCGIPEQVSVAMLRGWHAHNGPALGNRRLGFVCTGQVAAGDFALSGYYVEEHWDLAEEERLRFATEPVPPEGPQPALPDADWPAARRARARARYALEYARSATRAAEEEFGASAAFTLLGRAARQVGLQFQPELAEAAGIGGRGEADGLALLALLEGADLGDSALAGAVWRELRRGLLLGLNPALPQHPAID